MAISVIKFPSEGYKTRDTVLAKNQHTEKELVKKTQNLTSFHLMLVQRSVHFRMTIWCLLFSKKNNEKIRRISALKSENWLKNRYPFTC